MIARESFSSWYLLGFGISIVIAILVTVRIVIVGIGMVGRVVVGYSFWV